MRRSSYRCSWRPFNHPDWIFEPKFDGFRAVAYIDDGAFRLISRNGNVFRTLGTLAQAIAQDLSGRSAILDGEIVRPGPDGRPMFYELLPRRGPFCFYAFDLSWLDGSDLRDRPLFERNNLLPKLLPRRSKSVSVCGSRSKRHGPVPRDLRRGHGGGCCEAGRRQVHAGSHDLGRVQEPTAQPGSSTRCFFSCPKAAEEGGSVDVVLSRIYAWESARHQEAKSRDSRLFCYHRQSGEALAAASSTGCAVVS